MSKAPGAMNRAITVLMLGGLLCVATFNGRAEEEPETVSVPAPLVLPGSDKLAAALSSPDTRSGTLLHSVALLSLKNGIENAFVSDADAVIARFNDDMNWLTRLDERYGRFPADTMALDPAAWQIHLELEQHDLGGSALVSHQAAATRVLIEQVFDRSSVQLAASLLPELRYHAEIAAVPAWFSLRQQAATDENLAIVLQRVAEEILPLPGLTGAENPAETEVDMAALFEAAMSSLQVIASSSVTVGVPDPIRLQSLRYMLLSVMDQMDPRQQAQAADILRLGTLIDGLHERRYLAFTGGLLTIVAGLMDQTRAADLPDTETPSPDTPDIETPSPDTPDTETPLPDLGVWLTQFLPPISEAYARSFADVDPRLNSVLAAVYDVAQNLQKLSAGEVPGRKFHLEMADAVAQLVMLTPDLGFYYDLPVRQSIIDEINICISIAAMRSQDGSPSLTRDQFDGCQESLAQLADTTARSSELSGDPGGPFGRQQVRRELFLTPWQRINYGIGYLHERYSTACEPPPKPLPNPLEWATLANLMTWLATHSPVYFNTPENEQRLQRMRGMGTELIQSISEQVDCVAGAGAGLDDPVVRSIADYRTTLDILVSGMREAEQAYRESALAPGSDIILDGGATQATAYRPDGLQIGPCDPRKLCEMQDTLSTTRALMGLFPDEYLVADQAGLGHIEICYANMEWTERRSELVRQDDENVANYYGRFSFDLKGRFADNEGFEDVFGFRFTSPDEHQYLFAPATDEVLDDSCPTEWVGTRIVTPLQDQDNWLVPNRLTYLAAARVTPSRLLAANWDSGAEWRDWFVTGFGVSPLEIERESGIIDRLDQRLRDLYQAQQKAVYEVALSAQGTRSENGLAPLFDKLFTLTTAKSLLRMNAMLFYPQTMLGLDAFRAALEGNSGLLDHRMLARFQEADLPVSDALNTARARLDQLNSSWLGKSEAVRRNGSVLNSLAHAQARLNHVYREYFAVRVSPSETGVNGMPDVTDHSKPLMQ